jgi:hypothetical protein
MANTLAYYNAGKITAVKGFIAQVPVVNFIKKFGVIYTPSSTT